MSIIIGADVVPVTSNSSLFENEQLEELIGNELKDILNNSDFRIFNLETPLTDQETPINKNGPNLIASTRTALGFKAMSIDLFTIANNHILDQGSQGLVNTIETLNKVGIGYVGAGVSLEDAALPYVFFTNGKKYGVYACAEHEFSIAKKHKSGANPFEPLVSFDHIIELKKKCDYIIILYHGGIEQYRYPSPYLQKVCRTFIEKGADLVVCQHSHCIGCEEKYGQGTIVYGQGNFLFDYADNEYWNSSILLCLNDDGSIKYIPIVKRGHCIRKADQNESKKILNAFFERSKDIKIEGFIDEKYSELAEENIAKYIMYLSGERKNVIIRIINKLTGYRLQKRISDRYREKMGISVRNYIECEAHRELLLKGLED